MFQELYNLLYHQILLLSLHFGKLFVITHASTRTHIHTHNTEVNFDNDVAVMKAVVDSSDFHSCIQL